MEQQKWFTLSVILNRVKRIFDDSITGNHFWLKVEIAQIKFDAKGHYYLELVEKVNGVILAKCKANIWRSNAVLIHRDLQGQKEHILKEGAEILCRCQVLFHPVYGVSITIDEIDLSYSLGEVERKKQQTIELITQRGLHTLNKANYLPKVLQRIAVIGAIDSAGHTDFITQLRENQYQIAFQVQYFDTTVQGQYASESIRTILSQIKVSQFDCVVIIRGGGASLDLDVFNEYDLAVAIANCPIAVLTGIGHETDSTVADYVSYARFKTPSALAAFIVERALHFRLGIEQVYLEIIARSNTCLTNLEHKLALETTVLKTQSLQAIERFQNNLNIESKEIAYLSNRIIEQQHSLLKISGQRISYQPQAIVNHAQGLLSERVQRVQMYAKGVLNEHQNAINLQSTLLSYQLMASLKKEHSKLEHFSSLLETFNINSILMKGFAVVRYNDKTIDAHTQIKKDDYLEIQLYNKEYLIEVNEIKEIKKWNNLLTRKHQKN